MKGDVENMLKTSNSMIGYIDRSDNVVAIEPSWNLGAPEDMGKFLQEKYPTKEDAMKLVDTAISIPKFRKDDYQYVDGYGDVICERLALNKGNVRPHIEFLYLYMKGGWQVSDTGIDWESIDEYLASEEASKKRMLEIKMKK